MYNQYPSGESRDHRNIRRILITLLLSVAMTVSMTGCGASSSSLSSTKKSSSSAPTKTEEQVSSAKKSAAASALSSSRRTSSRKVSLSHIPAYSGSPYVRLNGNRATFKSSQMSRRSYERYGRLDSLGRCTTCVASIGHDLMPTKKRGSIGMIKPTGWVTIRYSFVEGKYLYNRCHLIGYQLTAENANERNLITGTRYMNVQGMEPFESEVAQYIRRTGNHVMYRVTPIFKGSELVARGVHMEAKSVEDHGSGIDFNIYCYNVQPGVRINYKNGESVAKNGESGTHGGAPVTYPSSGSGSRSPGKSGNVRATYVVNVNTKKFHRPSCSAVGRTKPSNRRTVKTRRQTLIQQGYSPCKICNP